MDFSLTTINKSVKNVLIIAMLALEQN